MSDKQHPHQDTGHEWDGIRELNNPLPRWWLWTFYATVVFAIGYMVAYPAIPLFDSNSKGVLGYSSRGALEKNMAQAAILRAPIEKQLASLPLEQIATDPKLSLAAIEGGRSAFKVNCAQCHGSGAAGSTGFPNLNDDDWLWGGDIQSIYVSIRHGIRNQDDSQARQSAMPAFGRDGLLTRRQIWDVSEHVLKISGNSYDAQAQSKGAVIFAEQCAACHGPEGKGNRALGAPNLSDAIWLYGGDKAAIMATITQARNGQMPAWGKRLDDVTVRQLAVYVHALGGGE